MRVIKVFVKIRYFFLKESNHIFIVFYCTTKTFKLVVFFFGSASAEDCNMIPPGLLFQQWRSSFSVRTVSLKSPGVSARFVFSALMSGTDCKDLYGRKTEIFSNTWGFAGKYPESANVLAFRKQNECAPCSHCSFGYRNRGHSSRKMTTLQT